jgi:hypothetical protein
MKRRARALRKDFTDRPFENQKIAHGRASSWLALDIVTANPGLFLAEPRGIVRTRACMRVRIH